MSISCYNDGYANSNGDNNENNIENNQPLKAPSPLSGISTPVLGDTSDKTATISDNIDLDNIKAVYAYGLNYQYGINGFVKNYEKAVEYLTLNARKNDFNSQLALANLYQQGSLPEFQPNEEKALEWFKVIANTDDSIGQYSLAKFYLDKQSSDIDDKNFNLQEAFEYFSRAAKQKYSPAFHELGLMYKHGHHVEKDHLQAYKWFRLLSEGYVDLAEKEISTLNLSKEDIEVGAKWAADCLEENLDRCN